MNDILKQIKHCVEYGKIDIISTYPPDMKGQEGANELTKRALEEGIEPNEILENALVPAMAIVGNKFRRKEIFVPQMLLSARAMHGAMAHLKPYFQSGKTKRKGVLIIGTVSGDLHDIGKNIVSMIVEGGGWEVIDLGVDVSTDKFIQTIEKYPGAVVGLSALLTTTMENMWKTVIALKEKYPQVKILVGGAPLTQEFCKMMGADFYSPDPQRAVDYLNNSASY
jgi:methanogenic corrinoid protein MtbC1